MKDLKELLLEGRMKTKFPEWYKDCKVDYDGQLYFKAWFYAELLNRNIKSKEEVKDLMKKDLFYFDNVSCVDTKYSKDIPDVKCDGKQTAEDMFNKLLEYFKLNEK
jgi:hypothetical protein